MENYIRKEKQKRRIRFVLCCIGGLSLSAFLGYPGSPTIAITAALVLFVDRGYVGHWTHSWKRMHTQVIMGILLLVFFVLFGFVTPVNRWFSLLLAAILTVITGTLLYDRFDFAPLPPALFNATMVMATGLLRDKYFVFQRLIFCLLGIILAAIINLILVPRVDRYQVILGQLEHDFGLLKKSVCFQENMAHPLKSVNFLKQHLIFFAEDVRSRRYACQKEKAEIVNKLFDAELALYQLIKSVEGNKEKLSEAFQEDYLKNVETMVGYHQSLIQRLKKDEMADIQKVEFGGQCNNLSVQEIVVHADLLRYHESLEKAAVVMKPIEVIST